MFFSVLFAGAQKCKDLQSGKFRIAPDNTDANEYIITRTAQHQFEEVPSTGVKMQFDIKWTSECSYELSKPRVLKGEVPFPVSDSQVLYVKITKVSSTYYTAEMTFNLAEDLKMVKNIQIVK